MQITIQFYNSIAEPNYVYKYDKQKQSSDYLTFITEVKGVLKEGQDITAPIFTIVLPLDKPEIINSNYAYVDGIFKRWYFIVDRETGLNNTIIFYMKEDVLCSWQDEIGELIPLVTRQATDYDPYFVDGGVPIESKKYISHTFKKIEHLQQSASDYYPFDGSGMWSLSGFTLDDRYSNTSRNAMSIINRTYVMQSTSLSFWKALANPDFWTSLSNWFTDFASNIYYFKFIPFNIVASSITDLDTINEDSRGYVFKFAADDFIANTSEVSNPMILKENTYCILKCEDIEIELNHFNNFLDLYSTHSLFMPMLGKIELDVNLLKEYEVESVSVYYVINPVNWTCNIYVTVCRYGGDSTYSVNFTNFQQINPYFTLYKSETFEIGIDIPFGSTNANQKNLAKLQYGVKAVGSIASAPFTGGASLLGLTDIGDVASSTTSTLYRNFQKSKKVNKERYSNYTKFQDSLKKDVTAAGIAKASNIIADIAPSLVSSGQIINNSVGQYDFFGNFPYITYSYERVIPQIPSNYYELYGAPCNLTVALKTLKGKGFTVCSNLHMSGFSKASLSEISEIEELLLNGVIL